jgi:3'-phosphoadenosine 5'-phosphosulfate sulfotransferase (PAPS reductase)/FAD synthetase
VDKLQETMGILRQARERSAKCLVSYSGGKDSLCVLDMCCRTFDHVEAFFMYFVPDLEVCETQLELARKRWGVTVHQVPHWVLGQNLIDGLYTWPSHKNDDLRAFKLRDVYNLMIERTGIPMIATGAKRVDSLWRKRNLANTAHYTDVINPCVGWGKKDILAYLASHRIPLPDAANAQASGICLATTDLLWLHDRYPADWAKLVKVFPFAQAVVARRDMYGIA